jgi:DedD protein
MRTETIYLTGSDPEREPSTWQGQATTAGRGEPAELAAANPAPAPEPAAPVPAAAPPKSKASDRPGEGWAVQLGSFSARDNADTFVATLLGEGYPSFVASVSTSSKTLYRVYAGPRMSRDEAGQLARRLAGAGHEGLVVSLSANTGQGG